MSNIEFLGYKRPDGSVGIRNHVLILPTSICASDLAEQIAKSVDGCVSFHNQNGCSQIDIDRDETLHAMAGYAANPNIYGTLVLSLGCETCQNDMVVDEIKKRCDKPMRRIIIQKVGGTLKALDLGIRYARELVKEAQTCHREPSDISNIILGTNCGGSDSSSGLGSNPLIGTVSDKFVSLGATSVLCETPELFGAEHILAKRAVSKKVGDQIIKIVKDYEHSVSIFGFEMREGNPSPGNKAGGLTTLEEKSLGCIHKGGHSPIEAVYDYAAAIEKHKGLVIMDTPGNDPSSVAGCIAGGCQLVVFSTGQGTPTGNALAPVYRLTANPTTAKMMADNTDFDATASIYGPDTMEELRDKMFNDLIKVFNGRETCAESMGFVETALPHLCNYI